VFKKIACPFFCGALLTLTLGTSAVEAYDVDAPAAQKFYKSGAKYEAQEKYGRAVNAYYHAILMNPDMDAAFRSIGRVYIRKNIFKDALDNLKQALFIDKYDAETHYYLGVVYPIVEHNSEKALYHYEECLKLGPKTRKQAENARKWIDKLKRMGDVQHDDELIRIYNEGVDFSHAKNHTAAMERFRAAIDINPHYAPAHLELGRSLLASRKFETALKEFEEVLLIDPYNAEAHYGLGVAYPIALGDEEKGIEHYEHYLDLKPDAPDAAKVKEWIAKLEASLRDKQEEVQWYNKGVELAEQGNHEEAVKAFGEALDINNEYYEALHAAGLSLMTLQEYTKAQKCFEEALDIHPDYAEAHYGLGIVYPLLGENVLAVTHLWKYLELKPNAPDIKKVVEWIDKLEEA
jgi:tetratricopeptide (TPR) repeat protein